MAAELPEPPDGWTVSTETATHIALYDEREGRSLVVRPTEPPASDDWTVKGLAGYGPEYPVFADGVDREEAISEAWDVMETVAAGETASPLRTETAAEGDISAEDDGETEAESEAKTDAVDQADLTAFGDSE